MALRIKNSTFVRDQLYKSIAYIHPHANLNNTLLLDSLTFILYEKAFDTVKDRWNLLLLKRALSDMAVFRQYRSFDDWTIRSFGRKNVLASNPDLS